jgi:hypothetical protein
MCGIRNSNERRMPVMSRSGQVGEIRIQRTPETREMFPSRAPAVRLRGGEVLIGRESMSINGSDGSANA